MKITLLLKTNLLLVVVMKFISEYDGDDDSNEPINLVVCFFLPFIIDF